MARSGFKMKGSPMQRNFGIGGSPMLAVCAPGDTGPGCKLNSKMNKKGTVVSRALNKAGSSVKRGLDNVVDNIKKGNKKRKKKRNTVKVKGSLPRTLDTNPNFVNDYNPETRSKKVLDKIKKHEY